jgi:hypothetical protein
MWINRWLARRAAVVMTACVMMGTTAVADAGLLRPLNSDRTLRELKVRTVPASVSLADVRVSGTPTKALISWALTQPAVESQTAPLSPLPLRSQRLAIPAPPTVVIERRTASTPATRLQPDAPGALTATDLGPFDYRVPVTYRITLTDSKGAASSREVVFTPPLAHNPQQQTATTSLDGSVLLTWAPVEHAVGYRIRSRALAQPVQVSHTTQWKSRPMAPATHVWYIESVYAPGGVIVPNNVGISNPRAVLPVPTLAFLQRANGVGHHQLAQKHYQTYCGNPFDPVIPGCNAADLIRSASNWEQTWIDMRNGLPGAPNWPSVVLDNVLDLGATRRINCTPRRGDGSILCWTTTHSHYDPRDPFTTSLAIIVMKGQQAFFGHWEWAGDYDDLERKTDGFSPFMGWERNRLDNEHKFAAFSSAISGAVFDHQGRKGVPHACLSCHGGHFDPNTGLVTGASLLPVVPVRSRFRTAYPRDAAAEEAMRRINQIVLESNPAPAIVDQINAMYGGRAAFPGTRANDNAVPAGWTQQPGLYRQVILPYCASCHFAQRGGVHLRSWGNALQHKAAIQRTVCKDFTMPHAEIAYRRFWTDGGAVSLPGLLSTALGYARCPE